MEYTQQELQELIETVTGEILESESVYGGKRPLLIEYNLSDGRTVLERFTYLNPANSDSWASGSIHLSIIDNA